MVPLLVLSNLLGKPQWTRHLLMQCKYRVIQVSGSTYLTYIIMTYVCSPETHRTSLA